MTGIRRRRTALLRGLAVLTLLSGGLLAATPSAAQADDPPWVITDGDYTCFGKPGIFKPGTRILLADWNNNGKKEMCIGVARDRTIWYMKPKASGWKEIPGKGRADNMLDALLLTKARRAVTVFVANPHAHYISWWNADGWYGSWVHCSENAC